MPGGSATIVPSSVKVKTNDNFLSAELSEGLYPDKGDLILKRGKPGMMGLVENQGGLRPTVQSSYSHFEKDYVHQAFLLQTTATAGGAGASVVATIAAGYHSTAGTESPGRVGFILSTPQGPALIIAKDETTPGAHTITLAPWDGTATLSITTSDYLPTIGSSFGEGTDAPDGVTPDLVEYTNNTMIIKEGYEVTGSALTSEMWFEVAPGQIPGVGGGWIWALQGEHDTNRRFEDYISLQLLEGQKNTNTGVITGGQKGTEGLIPFITNGGTVYTWDPLSGFGLPDFDNLILNAIKEKAGTMFAMYHGIGIGRFIDDGFINKFNNGAISYASFEGKEEVAINLGFTALKRNHHEFYLSWYQAFDHQQLLGASSYRNYTDLGVVIPLEMTVNAKNEEVPHMLMRYRESGGYSRLKEVVLTGGTNGVFTEQTDRIKVGYKADIGFEGFAPERFQLVQRL